VARDRAPTEQRLRPDRLGSSPDARANDPARPTGQPRSRG
jgi:hypothetical protein